MARASTRTLLSLDRYSRIAGINPAHFNGGAGSSIFPQLGVCNSVWPQYTWQTIENVTSREDLATTIYEAEQDIKRVLGYSPALDWESNERHFFPRGDGYSWLRPIKTKWAKVHAGGRRAYEAIDTAYVTYSDEDGDGYDELATVTADTTLTDPQEVRVYVAGHGGERDWEIRQVKSVAIAGGTLTVTLDAWQLFATERLEAFPTNEGFQAIDVSDDNAYADTVELGREYNDTTEPSAVFRWIPGCGNCYQSSCAACSVGTSDGCLAVLEQEFGLVKPSMATYDDELASWMYGTNQCCVHPSEVALWYQAGETDAAYVAGRNRDPLNDYWARTIAWLATARLDKPLCGCGNVTLFFDEMRRDLARQDRNSSSVVDLTLLSNPFGTRVGEMRAWHRVSNIANGQVMEAGAW